MSKAECAAVLRYLAMQPTVKNIKLKKAANNYKLNNNQRRIRELKQDVINLSNTFTCVNDGLKIESKEELRSTQQAPVKPKVFICSKLIFYFLKNADGYNQANLDRNSSSNLH